ncbi:hypothetical protein Bbelb_272160 [Branchiostoma belcheri]|nr:hypothetical protein Bbelb_272160 [Branchiostoma belcheri]
MPQYAGFNLDGKQPHPHISKVAGEFQPVLERDGMFTARELPGVRGVLRDNPGASVPCRVLSSDSSSLQRSPAIILQRPRLVVPIPSSNTQNSVNKPNISRQNTVPSVLLCNARLLVNKLDEFHSVLLSENVEVAGVSETLFSNDVPTDFWSLDEYTTFTKSREHRRGGGLALYVRDDIATHQIVDINVPDELECMWLMLRPKRLPRKVSSIIVCIVYAPPNSDCDEILRQHLLDTGRQIENPI